MSEPPRLPLPIEDPSPEEHEKLLQPWMVRLEDLPPSAVARVRKLREALGSRAASFRRPGGHLGRCSVAGCDNRATELHHTARRAIVGAWAEAWPIIPVCHDCHELLTAAEEEYWRLRFGRRSG